MATVGSMIGAGCGTASIEGDGSAGPPEMVEAALPFGDGDAGSGSGELDEDQPCEGGAFPDDTEFREALCAVEWAQVDVLRSGGEVDPDWGVRAGEAIVGYADDRDQALADLIQLRADIEAAAG
jgi:hypothetical protein